MKKAWDDVKSFITITSTIGYFILTFLGKMTPEYQTIYVMIVGCYFGSQFEKSKQLIEQVDKKTNEENQDGGVG